MKDRRDYRGNRWNPREESTAALQLEAQLADLEAKNVSSADLPACLSWRARATAELERRA